MAYLHEGLLQTPFPLNFALRIKMFHKKNDLYLENENIIVSTNHLG